MPPDRGPRSRDPRPSLGLIVPAGAVPLASVLDMAVEAEHRGFDGVYVTEAWRSGFVPLSAIALRTSRAEVGPYVLNAYGRSPWLTGMSAVDVDELSDGRLLLGVGAGNSYTNSHYQGIPSERPLRKMREYVEVLSAVVRARIGDRVSYDGEIHSMTAWPPQVDPVRPSIPVMLAATSPRMVELAAQVADGVGLGSLLSVAHLTSSILEPFDRAAAAAGRDPSSLLRYAAVFVAVDDDAGRAAAAARQSVCNLYATKPHPHYDRLLRAQGHHQAADALTEAAAAGDPSQAAPLLPDELIDELVVHGDADTCVRRLGQYTDVLDRVLIVNVHAVAHRSAAGGPGPDALLGTYAPLFEVAEAVGAVASRA